MSTEETPTKKVQSLHTQIRQEKQEVIRKISKLTDRMIKERNSGEVSTISMKIETLNDVLIALGRISE